MPLNLLKTYPDLLDLAGFNVGARKESLLRIFSRDIEDNPDFKFRGIQIFPIKTDGKPDMERMFMHLTTKECAQYDDAGNLINPKHREFDIDRSRRLHWINHHVHERTPENITAFSIVERDQNKRQDIRRTYIYDKIQKYVIVMERRGNRDFFLLTAYYLNEPWAEKALKKKMKKKLKDVLEFSVSETDIKKQGSE